MEALNIQRNNMPITLKDKLEMANVFVKSNLMPKGLDRPEKVVIALEMGDELGLPPLISVMNIAVINNQPTLKADMMVALALRSGKIRDIKIHYKGNENQNDDNFRCEVTITRNGISTPFSTSFSRRDAKVAGLSNKMNWQKYERRMLKHRAIAYCIRDAVPEIFAGLYIPDEMENTNDSVDSIVINSDEHTSSIKETESKSELSSSRSEISFDEIIQKASVQQVSAITGLSQKLFSDGIIESFLYDKYQVSRIEDLSNNVAGEIIIMLQNDPDIIHNWLAETYGKTA